MVHALVNVYKFIVVFVSEIKKCALSKTCVLIRAIVGDIARFIRVDSRSVIIFHRSINNSGGFPMPHSLPLLQLVEDNEVGPLQKHDEHKGNKNGQTSTKPWFVLGGVLVVEQKRAYDVSCRAGGVLSAHND